MDTERNLGDIAANFDDMSHTLADLMEAVDSGGRPSEAAIDELQRDVEDSAAPMQRGQCGQGSGPTASA